MEVARVLRREGHEVTELRDVLPVTVTDLEVLRYSAENQLFLITCNRDDFLVLVNENPNPGLIVLVRRRSRQAECGHLLSVIRVSGESGLTGSVNFA